MKDIIILIIAIIINLARLFFKSHTIQIGIVNKTAENREKRPDLFSKVICKNITKGLNHNDVKYYTEAYNIIETEMKRRAKSGCNMNDEFGYEIAHMKAQTDCANDGITIISVTFAARDFVQNLCELFEKVPNQPNRLALIDFIELAICIMIIATYSKGKEDDAQRIVCVEILERLEKSKEFSTISKDASDLASNLPNTNGLKNSTDIEK
mgnify:CR=1 FL=1